MSVAARESERQMLMARPLAGCYRLSGEGVGPYRIQLYPWRTARAWVARPLGADTLANGARPEWSWTPGGPDSFDVRRKAVRGVTDFAVRHGDSSWTALMVAAPARATPTAAREARAERIQCPKAETLADRGRG